MTDRAVAVREERALVPAKQADQIKGALISRLPDVLPEGMRVERFQALVMQALSKNPDLLKAEPQSVVLAALELAQLGMEPTGSLSKGWLVTYGKTAQAMIGVRGLEELARKSGLVRDIYSRVVYEGDTFRVLYGSDERIEHEPAFGSADPTKITYVYAVAVFKDGSRRFEVMTKDEVDKVRARSRMANGGPWVTDYPEMARKTVVRRLAKTLPLAAEAQDAIERDDERWYGPQERQEPRESRTASVRDRIHASVAARNGPGAPEPAEVDDDATPTESAAEQTDGAATEDPGVCGATPGELGGDDICTERQGHKGPHKSAESVWPQAPDRASPASPVRR